MPQKQTVNSRATADLMHQIIEDNLEQFGYSEYSVSHGRTLTQSAAIHLWFDMIAESWNNAGISQKRVLEAFRAHDLPNSKDSVKSVYKQIMGLLHGLESTTEQTTVQPSEVIEELHRFSAERLNVVLPDFPSRER